MEEPIRDPFVKPYSDIRSFTATVNDYIEKHDYSVERIRSFMRDTLRLDVRLQEIYDAGFRDTSLVPNRSETLGVGVEHGRRTLEICFSLFAVFFCTTTGKPFLDELLDLHDRLIIVLSKPSVDNGDMTFAPLCSFTGTSRGIYLECWFLNRCNSLVKRFISSAGWNELLPIMDLRLEKSGLGRLMDDEIYDMLEERGYPFDWHTLHGATLHNPSVVEKLLLRGVLQQGRPPAWNYPYTPSFLGFTSGDIRVMRLYQAYGGNVRETETSRGTNVLMSYRVLSSKMNKEYISEIIGYGVDVNTRDFEGKNVLHYAAMFMWEDEYVRLFLDAGADVNAKDENGKTPSCYAHPTLKHLFEA